MGNLNNGNHKFILDQYSSISSDNVNINKICRISFKWGITGIHLDTCIHHTYTNEEMRLVQQPQRRMNPTLKDIVKEELQKCLATDFIYPISNSNWVSSLVVLLKKNGKWWICVDYKELNKATLHDYFPLPSSIKFSTCFQVRNIFLL